MIVFINDHRERFGVEPICRVLSEHDVKIAPSTFYAAKHRQPCARVRGAGHFVAGPNVAIDAVLRPEDEGHGLRRIAIGGRRSVAAGF